VTIHKRHQIVKIAELEIGAVGTDFSRRTSWRAREDLGRARTWKSMNNVHFSEMGTNAKITKIDQNHIFLDETGCILNEKMMPDVTITVPDLEIDKKTHRTSMFLRRNFRTLGPQTPPIPNCFLGNFRGQVPTWSFLKRLPSCTITTSTSGTSNTARKTSTTSTTSRDFNIPLCLSLMKTPSMT
jgi:hypothetical protein